MLCFVGFDPLGSKPPWILLLHLWPIEIIISEQFSVDKTIVSEFPSVLRVKSEKKKPCVFTFLFHQNNMFLTLLIGIYLLNDFLYYSFFVNYILSFSVVGLWTTRLLVQVHRIGYSLRLGAKDMTITIVIIKSLIGNRLECEWRHAQKRWSWEF